MYNIALLPKQLLITLLGYFIRTGMRKYFCNTFSHLGWVCFSHLYTFLQPN